jgi:adenylate kinase
MDKINLFFFGPPGSGKGTQVDLLGEAARLPIISPGELLRHEEDIHSAIGKKVEPLIDKGKMVPDGIVEKMIMKRLKRKDANRGILFDGFPRTLKQQHFILEKLKKISQNNSKFAAFYIKVSDREVKKRLSGRRVCDCGASYHLVYNPPKKKNICDLCGKKIYIRKDDTPKVIGGRLKYYHKSIKPILDFWKVGGKLIEIDGEKSIKAIHKEIYAKYNRVISNKKIYKLNKSQ